MQTVKPRARNVPRRDNGMSQWIVRCSKTFGEGVTLDSAVADWQRRTLASQIRQKVFAHADRA